MKVDRIILVACMIVGGYFAYQGWFEYGFWVRKGPGGGFLPVAIGLLTIALSLLVFKQTLAQSDSPAIDKRSLYPVAFTLVALLAIKYLGLLITVFLLVFLWLKILEKLPYWKSGAIGIGTVIFIYVVFQTWLYVPFPTGIFGI